MGVDSAWREAIRDTRTVVEITRVDQEKIDVLLLKGRVNTRQSRTRTQQKRTRAISFMCATKDAKSPKSPLHHRASTPALRDEIAYG